ncbi:MAG: cystathionine beta-lyase [Phenylobacterium sp.]|uniref:cystathionine beta-lyase n=1 Tax=Phenylobacterium sp. TaxID=1871053 RepID=UPI002735CA16|nr:cystathionine beta-lyase [Phenylobacterium sp.]MDP1643072.1 cystathionine beta-lyase [Phenylobacterium sp.]MDP3117234.1 cystathionine beta-lyase [Phenylobacterium sp.]MDP3384479.1 cystathionine beta-lyase [Phenylobacterium sp.]
MTEETRLIHSGLAQTPLARTVGPPIQRGSTVLLPNAAALYDHESQVTYGRQGLAAQSALIEALAELEHAAGVTLYPSGLAALTGALLAVLKTGDEVMVVDTVYKPTRRFCDTVLRRFGVGVRYYPASLDAAALMEACGPATRLIVLESPGSLSFEFQDVPAIAAAARARGMLTLIDNTWAAGLLFKPLDHGVDISVQALTKYVGGHSDVFMGSVAVREDSLVRTLDDGVLNIGWAVSPDDAYQMLRGLRTLATRMSRHDASGRRIATWLAGRDEVGQVLHPALPDAPGGEIWRRDYSGACGLFAFTLAPGRPKATEAFLDALEIFGLGFSWGGFESLAIDCDPQLSGRGAPSDYGGPLVRLHVGLEDPEDLMADLDRGFAAWRAAS